MRPNRAANTTIGGAGQSRTVAVSAPIDESAAHRRHERESMQHLLGAVGGRRVLDVGCGVGDGAAWLVSRGAQVVGVDVEHGVVANAAGRVTQGATFTVGDLSSGLPLADASFDAVHTSMTLSGLSHWGKALEEVARVLRPGGVVVASVLHPLASTSGTDSAGAFAPYFATGVRRSSWGIGGSTRLLWTFERCWLEGVAAVRRRRIPSLRAMRIGGVDSTVEHRTFSQVVNAFVDAGLVVDRVVEPLPSSELSARFPVAAQRLRRHPRYLLLRAVAHR